MNKTHIINTSWRQHLINHLTQKQPLLFGQQFKSFRQAFFPFDNKKLTQRFNQAYILLQQHQDSFPQLKASLVYPQSVQQLLDFIDECDQFEIDLKQIKLNLPLFQEVIDICQFLLNHIDYRPFLLPQYPQNITIYPQYLSPFQQHFIDKHQLKLEKQTLYNPQITAYQALNKRQEIEGLAQKIVNENIESLIILVGDLDNYLPDIKRIFNSYQIKYSCSHNSYPILFLQFYHHVMFYLTNDFQHKEDYEKLSTFPFLELKDDLRISEVLIKIFNHLQQYNQESEVYVLKERIESLSDDLDSPYFGVLLKHTLLQPLSIQHKDSNQIIVAGYQDYPPFITDQMVILGINTQSYPAFSEQQGLINESFLQHIPNYPTLEKRVAFHNSQMENIFKCSKELIISFSLMDYEGKTFEKPLIVDKMNLEFKKWPIIEGNPLPLSIKPLTSELAQQLFFRDHQLFGSVSSFETYFKNSYQYFIERGLKVRRPQPLGPDEALMGTINHGIMENLVRDFPNYVDVSLETIEQYTQNEYEKHLTDTPFHQFLMKRNIKQIELLLRKLKLYEQDNPYQTLGHEETFKHYTQLISDDRIVINGIVDRVDGNESEMLILDYKSSDQSLSQKEVLNGRKLQLITYGMILSELHQKNLMGVYYINMNTNFINTSLFQYSLTKGILSAKSVDETFSSESRLKGMSFNVDNDHPLVNQLRVKYYKNGNTAGLFDLKKTREHFNLIYEHLYDALRQGDITRYHEVSLSKYFEMSDLQRYKQHRFTKKVFMDYEDIDFDFNLNKGANHEI